MSIKKTFIIILFLFFIFTIIVGLFALFLNQNEQEINVLNDAIIKTDLLARELRQSSDDLTRLARTYVATGNPKFEQYYWDVLAIRNGEKPRPKDYERIYWDLMIPEGKKPRPDEEKISILDYMEKCRFTNEEKTLLKEALGHSNALVRTEEIAMNAMKGLYLDEKGKFTKREKPNQTLALNLMHDIEYHQNKADIMKPIDDFFDMISKRRSNENLQLENTSKVYLRVIIFFLVTIVVLLPITFIFIRRKVIIPIESLKLQTNSIDKDLDELSSVSNEISKSNLSKEFIVKSEMLNTGANDEISQLIFLHNSMIKKLQQTGESITKITYDLREINNELDGRIKERSKELKSSINLISATLNALPDIMYELDVKGNIYNYYTPKHEISYDSQNVIIGKNLNEVFPEYASKIIMNSVALASIKGWDKGATYSLDLPDGKKWFELSISIISVIEDTKPHFIVLTRDVTGRKNAENSLRESAEYFRLLFEEGPIAKALNNEKFIFVRVNKMFCQLMEYKEDELKNMTFRDITHPEHFEENMKNIQKLIKNEINVYRTEKRYITKTQKIIWGSVQISIIRNQEGNFVNFLVNINDITERKQAEESLKKLNIYNRNLIEVSLDPLVMINHEGRISDVNHATELVTGLSRQELIGTDFSNYFTEPDMAKTSYQQVFKYGNVHDYPLEMRHRDGHITSVLYNASVFRDEKGEILGVFAAARDITEHRRVEEMQNRIEKLESIGSLAGGIAHEFNNLFASIFGFIDLARIMSNDDKVNQYLFKAVNNIDRAKGLTQQLLTFAKGGTPVKKIQPMSSFIKERVKSALTGSNVSCEFKISESLPLCNFDETQINQVLNNIILNAKESMVAGGTIEVSVSNIKFSKEESENALRLEGEYIKISIKDFGDGIPKEILTKIFDPFFSTKKMGSGLGLSICYSIIKRHNGWIEVESESGKGSTFHIFLPAYLESRETTQSLPEVNINANGYFLVMDDEEMILDMMSSIFSEIGFSVKCVNNGKDAIKALFGEEVKNIKYSAVFLDLVIPGGIGGKEVIKEIRKNNKEIPVFVISGYSDDPVMMNPTSYGFNASICKPFARTEMIDLLNQYLEKKID